MKSTRISRTRGTDKLEFFLKFQGLYAADKFLVFIRLN